MLLLLSLVLYLVTSPVLGVNNLALNKPSFYDLPGPSQPNLVNDGNVGHMVPTHGHWWCVDLASKFEFSLINVYRYASDSPYSRYGMWEIRLSDSGGCTPSGYRQATPCYMYWEYVHPLTRTTMSSCNQRRGIPFGGRFVFLSTRNFFLSFNEVEIFPGGRSLALNQPSSSSSTYFDMKPKFGNDGDMNTFTATSGDNPAWWCVQLRHTTAISSIVVNSGRRRPNRMIKQFEIRLGMAGPCSADGFKKAKLCHKDRLQEVQPIYLISECNQGGRLIGRCVYINARSGMYIMMTEFLVYGKSYSVVNLAAKQLSVSSSSFSDTYAAAKGNDGDKKTMLKTKTGKPSWWCVKLPNVYELEKIVIHNADGEQMKAFEIRTRDEGACNGYHFKLAKPCYKEKDTAVAKPKYTIDKCNEGGSFGGRFVYINAINGDYLRFMELEVYGEVKILPSVAAKQPAWSSPGSLPYRGNDGNIIDVMQTSKESVSWWCVRLPDIYDVTSLTVQNVKGSTANRLSGFKIHVSESGGCSATHLKQATLCHEDTSGVEKQYVVTKCTSGAAFAGLYFFISVTNQHLTFVELQIFGTVLYRLPNIALNADAIQSSTTAIGQAATYAVDGQMKTCSRTNVDAVSWWCVDLGQTYAMGGILLAQKADAKVSFEMRIARDNYCYPDGFKTATVCYKGGAESISQCNQGSNVPFDARAIYISAANKALSLCEVKVQPLMSSACYIANPFKGS